MRDFATCTGRFSAEVEHAWLVRTIEAERHSQMYNNMSALLDAVTSPDDEVSARALLIEAKAAHSRLLLQAAFGWDAERRRIAEKRARFLLLSCTALILADAREDATKIWAAGTE